VADTNAVTQLGSRLELFVDHALIQSLRGLRLELHHPREAPLARSPLRGAYATVVRDGDRFRAWYRDHDPGYRGERFDGNLGEITCYAESTDGHEWNLPALGLHEVAGSRANNAIFARMPPFSHNFAPFLDARPGVPEGDRYKALAGTYPGGLHAFGSADGILWRMLTPGPVLAGPAFEPLAFDSQNVSFWSEAEGCYLCYLRSWRSSHGELRTVSRVRSDDLLHWSEPVALDPNLPEEHLYTSGTHPYFRAPHLYVALPTRFVPSRGDSTEILFMSSRCGAPFDRTYKEAFIRPGPDAERWGNRANYAAQNVLPTGPMEMSLWHCHAGRRYVLRTDGFASVHACYEPGELVSRPLTFQGRELLLNASTSATGSIRVELEGEDGKPLPGFSRAEAVPLVGDAVDLAAAWTGGKDLGALAGRPVRLRLLMQDCDVYAFRFR